MRKLGLHIRYDGGYRALLDKALSAGMPIFQSFFSTSEGRYSPLDPDVIAAFQAASFHARYVHSSFLINLADYRLQEHPCLKKELYRSQLLGFSHIIAHPGARVENQTREEALETIVRRLNRLVVREKHIQFVLENSAHGKKSLGGDLQDLAYIQERLEYPEKVGFCLDTAHAYVFGYDIKEDLDLWLAEVCKRLSRESIVLIHLNDTQELLGSGVDRHCIIGEGQLGVEVLKACVSHPLLQEISLILELPPVSEEDERRALELVHSWI